MTFSVTEDFRDLYTGLEKHIQKRVYPKLSLWKENPRHPSLHFKKISGDTWSLRISDEYRMLGLRDGGHVTWYWIGSHSDYDKILSKL